MSYEKALTEDIEITFVNKISKKKAPKAMRCPSMGETCHHFKTADLLPGVSCLNCYLGG